MSITAIIEQLRTHYVETGLVDSYFSINNGLCEDFALEAIAKLNDNSGDVYEIYTESFELPDSVRDGNWDWDLLKLTFNMDVPKGFTKEFIDSVAFSGHAWIHCHGKHYDAECPEGVDSFFDLPIFTACIKRYANRISST